ncbi:Y-family DNA polymerase [Immundisolibacter sp.]
MPWICALFPDLPLEALAVAPDHPAVVCEQAGRDRWLQGVNAEAARRGLRPGMVLSSAVARVPQLLALARRPAAEREALNGLACWLYRFGTPVSVCPQRQAVWVQVGPSAHLFGGWDGLVGALLTDMPAYRVQFGVAPTLGCSLLLAVADAGLHQPVRQPGDIAAAIAGLPLGLLPFDEPALRLLTGAGLRRIGEVLALPADALGRRLGGPAMLALERLLGRAPEAWAAFVPPARYRRRFAFGDPVDSSEALLFPIKMMLGEFAAYLRARDGAVQNFVLRLRDSRRRVSVHRVGLMSPTRDPARLLRVVREQLERLTLEDGILELCLEADRFEPATAIQDDLFGSSALFGQRLLELRERLAARLGRDAVCQIAVSPDRRPEAAMTDPGSGSVPGSHHPPRPPWLLAQPKRLTPARLLGTSERIELGWWKGEAAARDYFLALDRTGRVCWVYRDLQDGRFYLHGLWQ